MLSSTARGTSPGPDLGTCHLPGYDVTKGRMKLRPQQTVHSGWSRDKNRTEAYSDPVHSGKPPGADLDCVFIVLSESMVSGGLQIH